jgi:peptidoglycan/LPS O-acetylase OafA/YrhL|tara:strand:- start:246 stop:2270 length:2025 start_codon:yes stop_codon:yes gene_type:complete
MIYRPEIDGLRALAVMPVIFYHASYPFFSGGYLGVDIFFVISGYLISYIILDDLTRNKFSILNFWKRRAKRILPALLSVIIFASLLSYFYIPNNEIKVFSNSIVSSLFFYSNFFFQFNTGYFDFAAEYQPLIHTWSLSIEEQFYILFPIFLLLFYKNNYKLLLFIILILSLSFAQWGGNLKLSYPFVEDKLLFYNKGFFNDFMSPFSRVWELILGFFASIILIKKKKIFSNNKFLTESICFISLGLIFFSIYNFDKYSPYPSFYTLIPCLSTFFLIIFLNNSIFLTKFLSNTILVKIGLISYSLYLFHFPIFSLLKFNLYSFNNSYLLDFIIFFLVIIIAVLNYKFIETPFRKKINFKVTLKGFLVAYSLLLIFSSASFLTNGFENRAKFKLSDDLNNSFYSSKDGKKCFDINKVHITEEFCLIGSQEKTSFFVLGDSHVRPFYFFFENYFYKNNLSGYFSGYSGCIPFLGVHALRSDQKTRNCYKLNLKVKEFIKNKNIKYLVLISRWTYYTDGGYQGNLFSHIGKYQKTSPSKFNSREAFITGLEKTLDQYFDLDVDVVVLNQVPQQKINPKFYYYLINSKEKKTLKQIDDLLLKRNEHNKYQYYVKNSFDKIKNKYSNFHFLDFTDKYCKKNCVFGNLNKSYYIDDNHLSEDGVKFIEDTLINFFNKIIYE